MAKIWKVKELDYGYLLTREEEFRIQGSLNDPDFMFAFETPQGVADHLKSELKDNQTREAEGHVWDEESTE